MTDKQKMTKKKPQTPIKWRALQARLNAHCEVRGMKKKLGEYLNVRPAAISKLLNEEDYQPRADMTLRLVEWVTARDRAAEIEAMPVEPDIQHTAQAHNPAELAAASEGAPAI